MTEVDVDQNCSEEFQEAILSWNISKLEEFGDKYPVEIRLLINEPTVFKGMAYERLPIEMVLEDFGITESGEYEDVSLCAPFVSKMIALGLDVKKKPETTYYYECEALYQVALIHNRQESSVEMLREYSLEELETINEGIQQGIRYIVKHEPDAVNRAYSIKEQNALKSALDIGSFKPKKKGRMRL